MKADAEPLHFVEQGLCHIKLARHSTVAVGVDILTDGVHSLTEGRLVDYQIRLVPLNVQGEPSTRADPTIRPIPACVP